MYIPEPILILFMIIGLISVVIVFTAPWTVVKRVVVIDTTLKEYTILESLIGKVDLHVTEDQFRSYMVTSLHITSLPISDDEKRTQLYLLIDGLKARNK